MPRSSCSAGGAPTGRSARACAGCGAPAGRWLRPTCATSTPSRRTSARCWVPTTGCSSPKSVSAGSRCCCASGTLSTSSDTPRSAACRSRPKSGQAWCRRSSTVSESNGNGGDAGFKSLRLVPRTDTEYKLKDFKSDQEVRWCPGCGDYAILAAFQGFLPELEVPRENIVIVSGIGYSSRFPYYLSTYGMHSIHGRAPAIATGLAASRPDLSVWVITGAGDGLSIGGNHLIHALRRNVNINVLLFNNRIYGLTKGQYSPTSEAGKVTKSSPVGSLDHPFNPVSLALGAEASFVARTVDSDRKHLTSVLREAADHPGASFVEIYQNCPIFNDDAFTPLKDPAAREDRKSTRLNSSHVAISYAVFCLK